jgi:hypothetical protein
MTAVLLLAAAVAMMLLVRARPATQPFDPRSDAASGTRGLVILLRHEGASVEVVHDAPAPGSDRRVLVLQDRLSASQHNDLLAFAAAGGVVVMADPGSALLGPQITTATVGDGTMPPIRDLAAETVVPVASCDIPALQHLRGLFVLHGVLFARSGTLRHCFGSDGSLVIVHPHGTGVIVQLGDNALFTNQLLRYADNGGLATALLAPAPGANVSIFVGDGPAPSSPTGESGGGGQKLADLVRPGVWMAFAQLALAFVVFAIARAVRPGRPVREPEQVPIAGSELVVATGVLMQRAQHASRAGSLLRFQAHRTLCERHHLPASTPVSVLDAAITAGSPVLSGTVTEVLEREVHDAAGLLRLSNDLHLIQIRTAPEGAHP